MTLEKFLEELTWWSQTDRGIMPEGIHPNGVWSWEYGQKECPPDQRPQWEVNPDKELRCGCRCPITYLAQKEHGSEYEVGEWDRAAEDLGLEDAPTIVDATDMIHGHDPHLRKKLLEACGIKGSASTGR